MLLSRFFPHATNGFALKSKYSTAAMLVPVVARVRQRRRGCGTKFLRRESHGAENTAGIIVARTHALLVGNAVLGCLDKILGGAGQTNDREDTQRDHQISARVSVAQNTVETVAKRRGNIVAAATAVAAACFLDHSAG